MQIRFTRGTQSQQKLLSTKTLFTVYAECILEAHELRLLQQHRHFDSEFEIYAPRVQNSKADKSMLANVTFPRLIQGMMLSDESRSVISDTEQAILAAAKDLIAYAQGAETFTSPVPKTYTVTAGSISLDADA
jgi:hypothetical protein